LKGDRLGGTLIHRGWQGREIINSQPPLSTRIKDSVESLVQAVVGGVVPRTTSHYGSLGPSSEDEYPKSMDRLSLPGWQERGYQKEGKKKNKVRP